eukprot:6104287-Pyramimonas_sp.AAC.1
MGVAASSDSIEDAMRLCPQLHLRGKPLSSSREGAGKSNADRKGDNPVLAPAVDPTEPAPESECTYETASSEPTNADIEITAKVAEDMGLKPGAVAAYNCRG